jgi:PiT family inorganic phosphate transporter
MNLTLIAVVVLALFFDFTNGFHDAANAIATSVSTRALTPRAAVVMAGLMNFAGAFISIKVATTVGQGVVDTDVVTLNVVLAAIVGAIVWNLITWALGLPSSSSHALIGGVAGAAIAAAGFDAVQWQGVTEKVLLPSLVSIFAGIALAGLLVLAIMWAFRRLKPGPVNRIFRRLQILSAGFVALTHGTNDAQKTMGVIALALVAANPGAQFSVPVWVIVTSALAISLGTYAGGWRIVRTLGRRVTHLTSYQGFAAETATAGILFTTAHFGFPVSTTHTISGSVLGAGAARKPSAVRWGGGTQHAFGLAVHLPRRRAGRRRHGEADPTARRRRHRVRHRGAVSAGIFFVARAQATAPPSGGLPVTIPAAPVTSGRPR